MVINILLEVANNVEVKINYCKTKDDEKWDVLNGYVTNTDLSASSIYKQYSELWQIERF